MYLGGGGGLSVFDGYEEGRNDLCESADVGKI